jgi:hypothetical protein
MCTDRVFIRRNHRRHVGVRHAGGDCRRTVFWHSLAGAAVIGAIAMLQAYVFPGMIPIPPVGK